MGHCPTEAMVLKHVAGLLLVTASSSVVCGSKKYQTIRKMVSGHLQE